MMEKVFKVTVEIKKPQGKLGENELVEGEIITNKTQQQIHAILSENEKHKPEKFTFRPSDLSCTITSVFSYQIITLQEIDNS